MPNWTIKDIPFTITCDHEKQQILTFEELEAETIWHVCLKRCWVDESIIKIDESIIGLIVFNCNVILNLRLQHNSDMQTDHLWEDWQLLPGVYSLTVGWISQEMSVVLLYNWQSSEKRGETFGQRSKTVVLNHTGRPTADSELWWPKTACFRILTLRNEAMFEWS